jgi:hypothetical protein
MNHQPVIADPLDSDPHIADLSNYGFADHDHVGRIR